MSREQIDHQHLKKVAGSFVTGIALVATTNGDGKVHGMTANSFLSVSLEPPLVLFSIMQQSAMLTMLKIGVKIGISILNNSQKDLSMIFAGNSQNSKEIQFELTGDCPLIKTGIAWYATEVDRLIPAGDHTLVLCRVHECKRNEGEPLVYFNGYWDIGTEVKS